MIVRDECTIDDRHYLGPYLHDKQILLEFRLSISPINLGNNWKVNTEIFFIDSLVSVIFYYTYCYAFINPRYINLKDISTSKSSLFVFLFIHYSKTLEEYKPIRY